MTSAIATGTYATRAAYGGLGAPGISIASPEPVRSLVGVRRDVAAFFGIAPRGPVRLPHADLEVDDDVATWLTTAPRRRSIPVPITSWDEYRRHFGGYEGPGRLPYAVSTYFAGGGRLAYVVRVVHEHGDSVLNADACASGLLGDLETTAGEPIRLFARNEGSWGNLLRATLRFATRPIAVRHVTAFEIGVDPAEWVPTGSMLRLGLTNDAQVLDYVDSSVVEPVPVGAGRRRVLRLAGPVPPSIVSVEVVTATLEVVDGDPRFERREVLLDIGLRSDHPRALARVLADESTLVWPSETWAAGTTRLTDPHLSPVTLLGADTGDGAPAQMTGGRDRWHEVVPDDFFDGDWVPGDELVGDGIQSLADRDDVGLLLAPDLYDPQPIAETDDVTDPLTLCGPDFATHVDLGPVTTPPPVDAVGLTGLRLDPLTSSSFDAIVAAQRRLVDFAEFRRDLTVLLDVPLGLPHRRALDWRNEFDSQFAAAYHPWIDVAAPDDQRDTLVRINPSAFAAGIIAARELRLGVQHGPANEIAVGAVRAADNVQPNRHDELHVNGVNVFVAERDGIRLTGARTLSRQPALRQLSVARLLAVIRLTLEREMQWAVFEPSNRFLWAEVRRLVHDLLTRFFEAGAFSGATTKEAFFVHCDDSTMTRNDLDNGRLVCLVGVAPVEPVEYIVIEIALSADRGVSIQVAR
jgi:uncharacterized protein